MISSGKSSLDFWHALSRERVIALARLVLALTALIGQLLAPPLDGQRPEQQFAILIAYAVFAILLFGALRLIASGDRRWFLAHLLDLILIFALLLVTGDVASPYFVFCLFPPIAATLRWNRSGAIWTTVTVVVLFGLMALATLPIEDPDRLIVRLGVLLVWGGMLAYFAHFEEVNQLRLHAIARWPTEDFRVSTFPALEASMEHASRLVGATRIAILWRRHEDPQWQYCRWQQGDGLAAYGRLIADGTEAGALGFTPESTTPVPFHRSRIQGCVLLSPAEGGSEDLRDIVCFRLGSRVERHELRKELAGAIALRERERLTRDIHDSLLQVLAGTALQLNAVATRTEAGVAGELEELAETLRAQQADLRRVLYQPAVTEGGDTVLIRPALAAVCVEVERVWRCNVSLQVDPDDLGCGAALFRDLDFLIREAVANAVRHGGATEVDVAIERQDAMLILRVANNGMALSGVAPRSLSDRAGSLGGDLAVERESNPVQLRIRIPI